MFNGLTFRGVHSSVFSLVMLSKNRQLLPANTNTYVDIPGRDGSLLFPGSLSDRLIEVEFTLTGTLEARRLLARIIANWLYSKKREKLIFDDEPGKYYLAQVSEAINLEDTPATGTFTVVFRCDPCAYEDERIVVFNNDQATINYSGLLETFPSFTATFTSAATEWQVSRGDKFVRIVRDFAIGEVLEVDCATGKISINGTNNISYLDWQHSEFFSLIPGQNTLITSPTGVSNTEIKYSPRWI